MPALKRTQLVALLLAVGWFLYACGGGGDEADDGDDEGPPDDGAGFCEAASIAEANSMIQLYGPMRCRKWRIAGQIIDGSPYPDFLAGGA